MNKRTAIVLAALALSGPAPLRSQATSYVIDNVNVVDVAAGTVRAGQRVVVSGSRYHRAGPGFRPGHAA
jgi:hypothetical protein